MRPGVGEIKDRLIFCTPIYTTNDTLFLYFFRNLHDYLWVLLYSHGNAGFVTILYN